MNVGNIDDMLNAIHPIPYQLGVNDDNADEFHRFCPKNADSWCKYQAALYSGRDVPYHPNFLNKKIRRYGFEFVY